MTLPNGPTEVLPCHTKGNRLSIHSNFWTQQCTWHCHSLFEAHLAGLQKLHNQLQRGAQSKRIGGLGLGSQSGLQNKNVRGIANQNHGGKHMKAVLPETPWVHPDAEDAFTLFLQCSRVKWITMMRRAAWRRMKPPTFFFAMNAIFFSDVYWFLGSMWVSLIECLHHSKLTCHPFL